MTIGTSGGTAGLTVLVLAGTRPGRPDPLARAAGVTQKALLPLDGVPMLARVLATLQSCPDVARIVVSAEGAAQLLAALPAPAPASRPVAPIIPHAASSSPSGSVAAALAEFGAPMLVTTADHPLLTPSMVAHLLQASAGDADLLAAVARAETVLAAYPDTARTWLRFRDGSISGCNLFLLRTARAGIAVAFWQRVEQQRKRPLAMAWTVGPIVALGMGLRLLTLGGVLRRLGARLGLIVAAIDMPFAEAAIDVDKPSDLRLVETILQSRRAGCLAKQTPLNIDANKPSP